MKSLYEHYEEHRSKVSDKWELYLSEYDRLFASYRNLQVSILEIGIQNGGSLEIWSQYFPSAKSIIGCDVNEACKQLSYSDSRIKVVVGDAGSSEIEKQITIISETFDIVIDDGSHTSSDIVTAFSLYFKRLNYGGIFVAEDLHCSYWSDFEGGLHHPYSSLSFFKKLADIVNFEHWGLSKSRIDELKGFSDTYGVILDENMLATIHSIEFINSVCVVRKQHPADNLLGRRFIAGHSELVVTGHRSHFGSILQAPDQQKNFWSSLRVSPQEDWLALTAEVSILKEKINQAEHSRAVLESKLLSTHDDNILLADKLSKLESDFSANLSSYNEILSSTSWRLTYPIRASLTTFRRIISGFCLVPRVVRQAGGIKSALSRGSSIYRREGIHGVRRVFRSVAQQAPSINNHQISKVFTAKVFRPAESLFVPRVLIIGELSIAQCKKYRVDQKQEMFNLLHIESTVLSWNDTDACINAMQVHSMVIFYRVPAFDSVKRLINEAKRLTLPIFWDVDDLIFDEHVLRNSKTLKSLHSSVFQELINGAHLYSEAMTLCGMGLASTIGLQKAMLEAGSDDAVVIENGLDSQTLQVGERLLRQENSNNDHFVRIVYGSGTNTHNVDFLEAEGALVKVLKKFPNVKLRVIGELDIPQSFKGLASQLEIIHKCSYEEYLSHLYDCDINIAPLENYIFNDSKSNIKFLEASVLKIPSVCSPRSAFCSAIENGVNGYLCEGETQWEKALTDLIEDEGLRLSIGSNAHSTVIQNYMPLSIASNQLSPILSGFHQGSKVKKILSVNCYYNPRSFGGATIVAEEVNRSISMDDSYEVFVFTSIPVEVAGTYGLKRYDLDRVNIIGIGLPDDLDPSTRFDNPNVIDAFNSLLDLIRPDIVHFHSIQGLGIGIVESCRSRDYKYFVTLHDAWWLCGRQFMINQHSVYCGQRVIDRNICSSCINNGADNNLQLDRKRMALDGATALFAPSEFSRDLYTANGFNNVVLNKNGIAFPANKKIKKRNSEVVRFGYVGGNTRVKGFHLIQHAFQNLSREDVSLLIVDNAKAVGVTSLVESDVSGIKNVTIIPAYTQETIDSFFDDIDVLLFPSQCKESFGLTVREAIIRDVWVITTDAGGAIEDIVQGQNGVVIPFDDTGAFFLKAIEHTIDHYRALDVDQAVSLNSETIRTFSQQADELVGFYVGFAGD